jgi:hypothetical protein
MPSELSKRYDWSLVVDEQELRRLVHEMAGALPQGAAAFGFKITLADGFSHSTGDIEEVLREENRDKRKISSLVVTVTGPQKTMTVSIGTEPSAEKTKKTMRLPGDHDAREQEGRKRSRLTVEGDERDSVYVVFSKLEERLRQMKARKSEVVMFPAMAVYAALAYLVHGKLVEKYPDAMYELNRVGGRSPTGLTNALTVGAFMGLVAMLVPLVVLYPHLTFKIGYGVSRHERIVDARSKLAWILVGTVAIGTVARLIVSLWT